MVAALLIQCLGTLCRFNPLVRPCSICSIGYFLQDMMQTVIIILSKYNLSTVTSKCKVASTRLPRRYKQLHFCFRHRHCRNFHSIIIRCKQSFSYDPYLQLPNASLESTASCQTCRNLLVLVVVTIGSALQHPAYALGESSVLHHDLAISKIKEAEEFKHA